MIEYILIGLVFGLMIGYFIYKKEKQLRKHLERYNNDLKKDCEFWKKVAEYEDDIEDDIE